MPTYSPIERLPAARSRFVATFSKEEISEAQKQALEKLGSQIKLPGFRPGHVPADLVKDKIDENELLEQTIRNLLPGTFSSLVRENSLRPIVPPKVELESKEPLKLGITFVEKPPVKIKNGDKIKIEKKEPKVDDKDIERMLDYLREQNKTAKEVDRPAKNGDQMTMDFAGTDADGKEIPGTKTSNYEIVLGKKTLIPGFEEELVGLSKGATKKFTLTFPEKYHAEHLRSKPVTFEVSVKKVEEVTLPEFTDAYVKEQGFAESATDLKKNIEGSMRAQEEGIERQRREQLLFDTIRDATQVELAPELLEQEEHMILEDLEQRLKEQNLTISQWMEQTKKDAKTLGEEIKKQGEGRLRTRLGLQQLIDDRKIEVSDEQMKDIEPAQRDQVKWQRTVETLMEQMLAA